MNSSTWLAHVTLKVFLWFIGYYEYKQKSQKLLRNPGQTEWDQLHQEEEYLLKERGYAVEITVKFIKRHVLRHTSFRHVMT